MVVLNKQNRMLLKLSLEFLTRNIRRLSVEQRAANDLVAAM